MKKALVCLLLVAMVVGMFSGCGSSSEANKDKGSVDETTTKDDSSTGDSSTSEKTNGRDKITALMEASESSDTYQLWSSLFDGYLKENDLDIKMEYELIPNDSDYANKLQLYIASDNLPDFYGCANGTFSNAAKSINSIINVGEELKKIGKYEDMNDAVIDFLTDAEDGELYLFPNALYCEFFWYRTDKFEQYGLKEPTTWDEFLKVCATLKENGEIPIIIAGGEQWQLMRYLSFMPWRATHDKFIMSYAKAEDFFADNKAAQAGVDLLATIGTSGYFQSGFTSTNYTDATNLFFGGTGCIYYGGSGHISNASEMYENGQLGTFPVPAIDGMENISTNVPIHAGFANTMNAKTYDDVMQGLFAYICDNFHEATYAQGLFSPFDYDMPQGLDELFYEIEPMFAKAEHSWVSWDDKLDPATVVAMEDAQEELALGMISPEEFIQEMDKVIIKNVKKDN